MTQFGAHAFLWIDDWTVEKGNYAIAEAGRHGFDFTQLFYLSKLFWSSTSLPTLMKGEDKRIKQYLKCSLIVVERERRIKFAPSNGDRQNERP